MQINKKNISVEPLFKNYKKIIHLFIYRRLRSYVVFECNNAGLKKLSQVLSEQTSDSSAFLKCHMSFKVYTQLRTAFFIFKSGLTVTGLSRVAIKCPHG
jgi:hypothetical protein